MLAPDQLNARDLIGRTPLHNAVMSGNEKLVLFFLEQDGILADLGDLQGKTPLHLAAETGIVPIIRQILSMDINLNAKDGPKGEGVFRRTIPKNKLSPAQELSLIEKDRVRHLKSSLSGRTALHLAAMNGKAAVVEVLLQCDCIDVNSRNNAGVTFSFIKHHLRGLLTPASWAS
jgi:ankyrin repeat protein